MNQQSLNLIAANAPSIRFGVTERSNRLINYFLGGYFLLGLIFAPFYGTWLIGFWLGGSLLTVYYSVKILLPKSCIYQYILSIILGIFMAQFFYQMRGMFEMYFFAFIGSALLITFQNWKLQLPMLIFVVLHYSLLSYLENIGANHIHFRQLNYMGLPAIMIHMLLTVVIFLICGFCAFQMHKYQQIQVLQAEQLIHFQESSSFSMISEKNSEAMKDRNTILESIGDAFFAVDKDWIVTYWNQMAEKVLMKTKKEMLNNNLWSVFNTSTDSESYRQYHQAAYTNSDVHFEDYFQPLDKWYEISAYPSSAGLSVYFKDITERKQYLTELQDSEQRYSDVFHFSPLPMWVVDLASLKFMDVNQATIIHYGYSRQEFLNMTLMDIRPPGEISNMEKALARGKTGHAGIAYRQMIHRKKNGELMNMEIQLTPFQFKGIKSSIVIATDNTQRLKYVKAIELQNEKLHAIAWMQSHVIRAPLARIMGLIPIFIDPKTTLKEKRDISKYLVLSANEMDKVIKNITDVTCAVAVA